MQDPHGTEWDDSIDDDDEALLVSLAQGVDDERAWEQAATQALESLEKDEKHNHEAAPHDTQQTQGRNAVATFSTPFSEEQSPGPSRGVPDTLETHSGLRIRDRKISRDALGSRLAPLKFTRLPHLFNILRPQVTRSKPQVPMDMTAGWATIAVLVEKSLTRQSQKGNKYQLWKIADLKFVEFSLFLFGEACRQFWKEQVGSIVLVTNASILPGRENAKSNGKGDRMLALSVDTESQILVLGTSVDMGICKGVRKDGTRCRKVINTSDGEYCEYHVQAAYWRMKSSRPELVGTIGGGKNPQLTRKVSSSGTFYRDGVLLEGRVHKEAVSHVAGFRKVHTIEDVANNKALCNVIANSKRGGAMALKALDRGQSTHPPSLAVQRLEEMTRKTLGPSHTDEECSCRMSTPLIASPQLARGVSRGDSVLLEMDEPTAGDEALARAVARVKARGGLSEPPDPNTPRNTSNLTKEELLQRRQCHPSESTSHPCANTSFKRKLKAAFGHVDLESEEGKRLLQAKSRHSDVVDALEEKRNNQWLDSLEEKDQMLLKMDKITKKKVKAFYCTVCHYTLEHPRPTCQQEGHRVTKIEATKRWFSCKNCHERVEVLNLKFPAGPCGRCGSESFEQASMLAKKGFLRKPGEDFRPKGDESSTAVSTTISRSQTLL